MNNSLDISVAATSHGVGNPSISHQVAVKALKVSKIFDAEALAILKVATNSFENSTFIEFQA